MGNKQFDRQNQWIKENMSRLSIVINKEERPNIDNHWKKKGYASFNKYVIDLIHKDMEADKKIIVGDINQQGENNNITIG